MWLLLILDTRTDKVSLWCEFYLFGALALIRFLFGMRSACLEHSHWKGFSLVWVLRIRSTRTDKASLWCEFYLHGLNNTIAVILKQWTMVWLSTSIRWAPEVSITIQAVSRCCCIYTRCKLISLLYTKSLTPTTRSNQTTCTQTLHEQATSLSLLWIYLHLDSTTWLLRWNRHQQHPPFALVPLHPRPSQSIS